MSRTSNAPESEPRLKAGAIDQLAPIAGLGTNLYNVRALASFVLSAIGVNQRADDGAPKLETIMHHALTEFGADLRRYSEGLRREPEHEDIANALEGFHAKLELINECSYILADIVANDPSRGGK